MGKKGHIKISLIVFFLLFLIIIAMACYIYTEKVSNNNRIADLEDRNAKMQNVIDNIQTKMDNTSNTTLTENENTINTNLNKTENTANEEGVSFIIISIENELSEQGIAYKSKLLTDKKEMDSLMNIINSAEKYEPTGFIPESDVPPIAEINLNDGDKYFIYAEDGVNDGGNTVNLMTKYSKKDGSDKTLFKIDTQLANYIINLYKNSESSSTSEKEIYKRVSTNNVSEDDLEFYNHDFLIIENGRMYFSNDLSNKILEGRCRIRTDDVIEYNLLQETQDYQFYTSAEYRINYINGKKNIVVDCSPQGIMHFQKLD